MTADRPFGSADDLELLAEYAAGLLDGTPEAARLAARLASEPELARLHEALTSADALVRADLAALPTLTMPADVAADLDALLAAEPPLAASTPLLDPAQNVVPIRRRRQPWLIKVAAVAAGVALFGGIAVGSGLFSFKAQEDSRPTAAGAARTESAQPPTGFSAGRPYAPRASGTDYTAAQLAAQVSALLKRAPVKNAPEPRTPSLAQPPLASCLAALGFGDRILAVDSGSFEGTPALVVVAAGASATQADVAVVGLDCGRNGTHERLRTTVSLAR